MIQQQKRIAAIHDISGFGKCSLTVALPILSAAGIETSVIPTAVLSTHTGGFTGFTYRDLTEDIRPFVQHWKSLDLKFDAIYTGFLGSFEQLELMKEVFDMFKSKDTLIMVDPVMADNGQLYSIFPSEFPAGMRSLCEKADLIVPNITEASLLVGEPYCEGPYTEEYIEMLIQKLNALGPKKIVLTGVFFDENNLGAATYDGDSHKIEYAFAQRIPGYFHGTGDIFGRALLGALLNGFDLHRAAQIAVNFTANSIRRTFEAKTDVRFGVNFEQTIPSFLKELGV
jgi:pyridoxine kinase